MTVRAADRVIFLEGACPVEDAEPLLALLIAADQRRVDLSACTRMHSAVVQLLLANEIVVMGHVPQGFLGERILPNLRQVEA